MDDSVAILVSHDLMYDLWPFETRVGEEGFDTMRAALEVGDIVIPGPQIANIISNTAWQSGFRPEKQLFQRKPSDVCISDLSPLLVSPEMTSERGV
jgi:hypothetical protein